MTKIESKDDGYYVELDEDLLAELDWDELTKVRIRLGKLKNERVLIIQEV